MDRPVIYQSSLSRRQVRRRRAQRRGALLMPRLATFALTASGFAFALAVFERMT